MRKHIIPSHETGQSPDPTTWLDLAQLASVELSSEDADFPIDAALRLEQTSGWRAASPGRQTIRLRFDPPQTLRHIHLAFHEAEHARTQECVLRWSPDGGHAYQELVRQQYTFSPPGTCDEVEDYQVNLAGVAVLELQLIPDISGGPARATLAALHVA